MTGLLGEARMTRPLKHMRMMFMPADEGSEALLAKLAR
jgi:hypothetical protein